MLETVELLVGIRRLGKIVPEPWGKCFLSNGYGSDVE
jgi:hypothetical protein